MSAIKSGADHVAVASTSGIGLILASLLALLWSNSEAAHLYVDMLAWRAGPSFVAQPLHVWVNEGLMSLFFLLVGLEIRREMTSGALTTLRGMAAPGIAALGGMVLPAGLYLALNHGRPATLHGWAIPTTTDIAFSLAVLRLLGRRAPESVRLFLTAVAILDDLAAIVVIGVFYARAVQMEMLLLAALVWLVMLGFNRAGVRWVWPYALGGMALWLLLFSSGVEATLAGVAMAWVVPGGDTALAARLEKRLEPLVYYMVLPAFGLFNAGIDLRAMDMARIVNPASLGVFLGLGLGKQTGVFGAALLGRWCRVLTLPPSMSLGDLYGAALLCGIGFTMSLFIAALAFPDAADQDGVKLAVLSASAVSALSGLGFLAWNSRNIRP
jgi:NhaA family Na+:H+ antiporter